MLDIIKAQGWLSLRSNKAQTFFYAVDKPFLQHTMALEVIVGEKVLINGEIFHKTLIPTIKEATQFSVELCDE